MDKIINNINCDGIEIKESTAKDHSNLWQCGEMVLISKKGAAELIKILQEWVNEQP